MCTESVGTVKRYDAVQGLGFIKLESGGKDVFVHATSFPAVDLLHLRQGSRLVVDYVQGQKGLEGPTLVRLMSS